MALGAFNVLTKLVKLAITIIGIIDVSDKTLKIIKVLIGVLVIPTLMVPMQHNIAIVGCTAGIKKLMANPKLAPVKNRGKLTLPALFVTGILGSTTHHHLTGHLPTKPEGVSPQA